MKGEWQPGDVALIGFRDYMPVPALYVSARQRWVDVDGAEFDGDEEYLTLRPLVVVDPDDQAQADRLSDALITAMCKSDPDWDKAREYEVRSHMRTALREFADPKPPKPNEPTGLGAVVEDADGHTWVRTHATGYPWHANLHPDDRNATAVRKYADIDAVRVLSEGVQS